MKDVEYEWKVEASDGFGDIFEATYFDRLGDAFAFIESNPLEGECRHEVCLVRNQYSREGIDGRSYAYLEGRSLPSMFDDRKHKVPIRFLREVAAFYTQRQ